MKKLRAILSALATLRRIPSAAIADAWANVRNSIDACTSASEAEIELIDQIFPGAVISLAKDDEDKATKPGKADKP